MILLYQIVINFFLNPKNRKNIVQRNILTWHAKKNAYNQAQLDQVQKNK
jgi:hypothetical protein